MYLYYVYALYIHWLFFSSLYVTCVTGPTEFVASISGDMAITSIATSFSSQRLLLLPWLCLLTKKPPVGASLSPFAASPSTAGESRHIYHHTQIQWLSAIENAVWYNLQERPFTHTHPIPEVLAVSPGTALH